MLRRARRNNISEQAISMIRRITRELRVIYADLFTGDEDDKTTKSKLK